MKQRGPGIAYQTNMILRREQSAERITNNFNEIIERERYCTRQGTRETGDITGLSIYNLHVQTVLTDTARTNERYRRPKPTKKTDKFQERLCNS